MNNQIVYYFKKIIHLKIWDNLQLMKFLKKGSFLLVQKRLFKENKAFQVY